MVPTAAAAAQYLLLSSVQLVLGSAGSLFSWVSVQLVLSSAGSWFSWIFLCGDCLLSMCLRGFTLDTLVSSHPKNMLFRLIGNTNAHLGVIYISHNLISLEE